ncbi:hypothetical protein AAE478_000565 [Parahypoxylon ruwenzoriense]
MSSWSLSPRDEAYMPPIPSPLNPLSPETTPRRFRRGDQYRVARKRTSTEQSPTQILMRQKAAAAWRSMASREASSRNQNQSIQKEADTRPITVEQEKRRYPIRTPAEHEPVAVSAEERRDIDMEKQSLIRGKEYRGGKPLGTMPLSHFLTTRGLAVSVGIVCIVGFLSAMRAIGGIGGIGGIHTWRAL